MNTLDMWLKGDIAHVIQGIAYATPFMATERSSIETQAFQEGFVAALSAVAISLGISIPLPQRECRVAMIDGPFVLDGVTSAGIPRLTRGST